MSPARAELLRSESQSCCTDVDVTSGGFIPCAGHGKFRSETASSEVEEHHGLNLSLSNLWCRYKPSREERFHSHQARMEFPRQALRAPKGEWWFSTGRAVCAEGGVAVHRGDAKWSCPD